MYGSGSNLDWERLTRQLLGKEGRHGCHALQLFYHACTRKHPPSNEWLSNRNMYLKVLFRNGRLGLQAWKYCAIHSPRIPDIAGHRHAELPLHIVPAQTYVYVGTSYVPTAWPIPFVGWPLFYYWLTMEKNESLDGPDKLGNNSFAEVRTAALGV